MRIGSGGNNGDVSQSNDSQALSFAGNAAKTDQSATQDSSGSPCKCGGGGGLQAAEQKAKTDQSASSDATSTQYKPSNSAISVRIGSGGNDGSVDQSNSSAAGSFAGNLAKTDQSATQSQGGSSCGCGGDAVQAAGQFAHTGQSADSDATSKQVDPSNSATSVRIASPGNDGDVHQSNDSFAGSFAGNAAFTNQTADQQQGSGGGYRLRRGRPGARAEGRHVAGRELVGDLHAVPPEQRRHRCPHRLVGQRRLGGPVQLVDGPVLRGQPREDRSVGDADPGRQLLRLPR